MKKITLLSAALLGILGLASCSSPSNPEASGSSSQTTSESSSQEASNKGIKIYTRDATSGTRDGFFTTIGFGTAKEDNTVLAKGYVEVASNGDMISSVKNDEYGIGYISLSTLDGSGVKGLSYEGVEATEENVLDGSYLLTRNFNYCVRTEYQTETVKKIVEAFIAYMNTQEGKATMKSHGGILSVKASDPTWASIKDNYPVTKEDNSSVTVKFGGSTSVQKMAQALTQEFSPLCGNFVAEHNHTGSGDAFKRTQGSEKDSANYLDVAFASREFKLTSDEALAEGTYARMCIDAIVPVVNTKNTLNAVTKDQLVKIYNGTFTKWSDLK